MSTAPKRAPAPPTLDQLTAELADLERRLHEARRGENAAKNELPRAIVAGDAEAIAQCREDIAFCEKRIKELTTQIETGREAARIAEERDRGKANGTLYKGLRHLVADELTALEGLEGAIETFAHAYTAAHKGLEALESKMRQANIQPDPLVPRAKLEGITDRALHLATSGAFGRLRSLESPDELRRSGAASLVHAGREWQAVTLRQVHGALHIPEDTSP